MDKQETLGLSVVIPIFNEVGNIPQLLENLISFSRNITFLHEFIIVDGQSTDGTLEALKNLPVNPNIRILFLTESKGYGADIQEGLKIAKYDYLGWTHADLQTDICDLEIAFYKIKSSTQSIIVKGQRKNRRKLERFFTIGMEVAVLFYTKHFISDINAQPKLFSKNFYSSLPKKLWPDDFSLDLFILLEAKKRNLAIKTVPVLFNKRQFGEAKGGGSWSSRLKLIKRTLSYVKELSRKIDS